MPADSQPMDDATVATRRSLIGRLQNLDDHEGWQEFFDTYWKLIYSVARKAGLTEQEAEEVVQETTIAVSKYIPDFRYDPEVCSFKSWLLQKTRWKIIDQVRKRPPKCVERLSPATDSSRTDAVERLPDPQSLDLDGLWEEEWRKSLIDAAMERVRHRVRSDHYQIFYLSAVRRLSPRRVAEIMGMTVARVYLVRHRVAALVRKEFRALENRAP